MDRSMAEYPHIKKWIETCFGDSNPTESPYVPGTFYKRMWRPSAYGNVLLGNYHLHSATESYVALSVLLKKLEELFRKS